MACNISITFFNVLKMGIIIRPGLDYLGENHTKNHRIVIIHMVWILDFLIIS